LGTVAFRINVPSKTRRAIAGSPRVRPYYISVSTKSVSVSTDGKNSVVANVSYGVAQVIVHPAAGTHTFTVTAYDQVGGQGNVLSTGTTAPVLVPPVGLVKVALTLDGVVAKVVLALDQTEATIGSPATIDLEISTQDADGNTILAGTTFTQPLTLTSSDPIDGKPSITTIAQPVRGVTVAYDGANAGAITFSVSGGAGLRVITPATLVPLPPPPAGEQIFLTGSPYAAFAAPSGNQLLATFGASPPSPFSFYGDAAIDTVAGHLYAVAYYYVNEPGYSYLASRFDIYDSNGSHALHGSFQPPISPQGVAIDSAAQKLYVSDGLNISIFSTAPGHASLGTFFSGFAGGPGPELALDPVTQRLFVSDNGDGGGLAAFSTVAPYARVGLLTSGPSEGVATDVGAGKVYALQWDNNYSYETVNVYDSSSFKRVAQLGPYSYGTGPSAVAVDSSAHRLYLLFRQSSLSPTDSTVEEYGIDAGFSFPLLGSFTTSGGFMTIAPYVP
jgi:hypothetical protein